MSGTLTMILPLIILLAIMYFLLIRPQKKREKEINAMRKGVQVGDEIITIGGICGKIVKTKEESLVIQVGADKVKFEIMRWAVSRVVEESRKPASKVRSEEPDEVEEAEEEKKPVKKSKLRKPMRLKLLRRTKPQTMLTMLTRPKLRRPKKKRRKKRKRKINNASEYTLGCRIDTESRWCQPFLLYG